MPPASDPDPRALSGFRVIELGGKGPTPFAGMLLADMGAEVFALRRLGARDQPDAAVLDRGKVVLRADLKDQGVRAALHDVIPHSDVVIEGFRPGVAERLGLGPEALCSLHPALVYGRMSGYGQTGPYAGVPGHDLNFVAVSSALGVLGEPGHPPTVPLNLVGDFGGGGMLLVTGVLAALLERTRSGRGQVVDAAMTEGAAQLMASVYGMRATGEWVDRRRANIVDGGAPFYCAYETADARFIAVGALDPRHYDELLRVCGIDDGPDQHDRARWAGLHERLTSVFRTRTSAEWMSTFEGVETSIAPVLSPAEAPRHPQHVARSAFVEIDGVQQPAPAPRFSRTPSRPDPASTHRPADALRRMGVGDEVAEDLVSRGAVG